MSEMAKMPVYEARWRSKKVRIEAEAEI